MRTRGGIRTRTGRTRTAVALTAFVVALAAPTDAATAPPCADRVPTSRWSASLRAAVAAGRDVLGEGLLHRAGGPSYDAVRRLLPPLHYARGPRGRALTRSGAYYLPFAYPVSVFGVRAVGLHVADGSEILTRRTGGPSLSIVVGRRRELYGSCPSRREGPRLAAGWQPLLRTTYTDADGVKYRQESFVGRLPGTRAVASFVRLAVDARRSRIPSVVRFAFSTGSRRRLAFEGGGTLVGRELRYRIRREGVIHVAWLHGSRSAGVEVDEAVYRETRQAVVRFWTAQLARLTSFEVPERRVRDAYRAVLAQQRVLTWRYSVGNTYEELSFAEALDAARVMVGYGALDVAEAILRFAARRLPARYSSWRAGALFVAAATYVQAGGERLPPQVERTLERTLRRLQRPIHRRGGTGLLDREWFSSDVRRPVRALHGQAVAWQGLRAIGRVWSRAGKHSLAKRASRSAVRLERALRTAIADSERRLHDGSLFVPADLLDGRKPFDRLTATRDGSYWNLVMPYVLASGLLPATEDRARAIWQYVRTHGGRFLGLVRADARTLYRQDVAYASGVDQVYGLNVSRFLADADLPDELALTLYGTLAGAMSPGTFVGGEAATIIPLGGARRGSMYLPPNGGTNTAFLETLRLMLVHERRNARGAPVGLDLAFSTPRAWLRSGATVAVSAARTSFGAVSFSLTRRGRFVHTSVDAPPSPRLRLRIRLPGGLRVANVQSAGGPLPFDARSGTIELPSDGGRLDLVVRLRA